MVPRSGGAAAAAALGVLMPRASDWRRTALRSSVRARATSLLPPLAPETSEAVVVPVEEALAHAGLSTSYVVHLGPPRANRKPVAVLLQDGTPMGVLKVGTNELTNRLVANEGLALGTLRFGDSGVVTPQLLASGSTGRFNYHVQSILPKGDAVRSLTGAEAVLCADVFAGPGSLERVIDSRWWHSLSERIGSLPPGPENDLLQRIAASWGRRFGRAELEFGSWHGDFTPWNAVASDRIYVWDWERFGTDVPRMGDAMHWQFTSALATGRSVQESAVQVARDASELLAGHVGDPGLTAEAYFLEIAVRYAEDGQRAAGSEVGDLPAWLPAVIAAAGARAGGGQSPE